MSYRFYAKDTHFVLSRARVPLNVFARKHAHIAMVCAKGRMLTFAIENMRKVVTSVQKGVQGADNYCALIIYSDTFAFLSGI